ncbi:hypothetical protein I317_05479 [Kwoniella heveanensis CBS 569]|nr:hypothetical protein I317_05479 [Kwoniella heveanensis CBS 569]
MSLRSHRSMSSVSSHISGMGWSTVGSDTASLSDTDDMTSMSASVADPSEEHQGQIDGHGVQQHSSVTPGITKDRGKKGGAHAHGVVGNSHHPGRVPSLSIDPKLFAPKKDDEAMLETAKPKNGRGKKSELVGEPAATTATATPTATTATNKKERKKGGAGNSESGKKVSHARKQNADHIPRPRNAFILFRKHVVDSKLIPASVEMRHQNVSIITAKMWSEAPPDQKSHFNELARVEKEEHLKKYPGYRYQPVYRRTNVIRRRVRKDEAEEEKCKSVAELLIKGKSGEALENEIKDKIRRGSGSVPADPVKEKVSSRRSSAACELSKGALRALRAQARQQVQGSGEWSDISRAGSIDPERSTSSRSFADSGRRPSYALESSSNASSSPEPMLGYGLGLAPPQMQGFAQHHQSHHQQQVQVQEQQQEFWHINHVEPDPSTAASVSAGLMDDGMAYIHPGMANFSFDQPSHSSEYINDQEGIHFSRFEQNHEQAQLQQHQQQHFVLPEGTQYAEQTFHPTHCPTPSFASASTDQSFSSDPLTAQSQSQPQASTQPFLYPQPALDLHLTNHDFYAYDTALPFSPSAATFSFPTSIRDDDGGSLCQGQGQGNEVESIDLGSMNYDLHFTQQQAQSVGMQSTGGIGQSMMDRWDGGHLLPPSSGVPLEGLPFDDGMMLGDFEAALAHADEVGGW